jgi:hypothetical protein
MGRLTEKGETGHAGTNETGKISTARRSKPGMNPMPSTRITPGRVDNLCILCYIGEGEEVVVMKLKLYYSTEHPPLEDPANQGFGEAIELLTALEQQGVNSERVDTSQLSDEEIYAAYTKACVPSVFKKFRIRRVFGTRRRSGCFFGRGVPALLVYGGDGDHPADVYPHEELGRTVTIKEFLEGLVEEAG